MTGAPFGLRPGLEPVATLPGLTAVAGGRTVLRVGRAPFQHKPPGELLGRAARLHAAIRDGSEVVEEAGAETDSARGLPSEPAPAKRRGRPRKERTS